MALLPQLTSRSQAIAEWQGLADRLTRAHLANPDHFEVLQHLPGYKPDAHQRLSHTSTGLRWIAAT